MSLPHAVTYEQHNRLSTTPRRCVVSNCLIARRFAGLAHGVRDINGLRARQEP
jgi:hypothetical protein